MRTLAIYYSPQECGDTYVILVDLKTGKAYKRITIPEGYEDSGVEFIDNYYPNGKIIKVEQSFCGSKYLNVDAHNEEVWGHSKIATAVKILKEYDFKDDKGNSYKHYYIEVEWQGVIHKESKKYTASKDTFKQELIKQGINMKGWSAYKRRKTPFFDFLNEILKEYNVVNLLKFY